MILILFFILFSSLNTEETEAMKAMDKKLFKAQLEKDLRNLENNLFKEKTLEPQEEKIDNSKEIFTNKLPLVKEKTKIVPRVSFVYNRKEYTKLLNDVAKIYRLKITNKGNIIIGNRINNLNLIDKLYGSTNFLYYPIKKEKYNSNKFISHP